MCRAADRLTHLCTALQLTPHDFATRLGLPPRKASCLQHPRRAPSRRLVARVLLSFPQVAPIWLLTGEGTMFLPAPGNYLAVNYGHCTQLIGPDHGSLISALQAHLLEKERTIQLLRTYQQTTDYLLSNFTPPPAYGTSFSQELQADARRAHQPQQ